MKRIVIRVLEWICLATFLLGLKMTATIFSLDKHDLLELTDDICRQLEIK